MRRGTLRVFLGAAPGVGKTFAMLEEGLRLQREGRTVVVGIVDTYGRSELSDLLGGLDVVTPPRSWDPRSERPAMDLSVVLARKPDVALVDELARANPPGSPNAKRWDDVAALLDAGIDVLSTLNIQNLESLNDVVYEITGVREQETIADDKVRQTAEIELVDLPQERIRERLKDGKIYPAEHVDAALANYFRPGNLSALRELALSWTADRVDETLAAYRDTHGIDEPWGARDRIVVWLPAVEGSDVIVRKAARTALRSRAELHGVYIRPTAGLSDEEVGHLRRQRELLEGLGGTYHELVGDNIPEALLSFARAESATQIVLGSSGRSRPREWLGDSAVVQTIRKAGTIEVHVISYETSQPRRRSRTAATRALSLRRRLLAWVLTATSLPLLTLLLLALRDQIALENVLLVYLLAAVAVGVIGGALPAVTCGAAGFLLANWYFTPPFHTWKIADAGHLFSLFAFLMVASAVGLLVGNATRRSAEARKARAQAEALAATATSIDPMTGAQASGLTSRIRDVFAMSAAAVLRRTPNGWEPIATVGVSELRSPEEANEVIPLTDDTVLALSGGSLTGDDRRVLRAFAAQMAQALDREKLEREAAAVEAMTETDRLRTALLNAVSHDLRTPLATIKASVTSLLETEVVWSGEQIQAFLHAILEETEHLNRVVGRLLDASRVQVGAVHVFFVAVGLDEVISSALSGLGAKAGRVNVDIPDTLAPVQTDPALLERVVANLIENALTWSPPDRHVLVSAGEVAGRVDLRIIDRGPGIPADERDTIYQPFQRLGDSSNRSGVGLGMAVARGFLEAMGNELTVEDTPGGGTTMVIGFKPAPLVEAAAGTSPSRQHE
ncbi:MAG TPA: ATP-binding protein [Acidimicrobiia bacterium]|nr:ATP-binding protein [Acidimicrobiia bacterium]